MEFSKNIERLKEFSDLIYTNSRIGIYKLPVRFRLPIALASKLYQGIGFKIKRNQYNVWDKRHYLSLVEKLTKSLVVLIEIFFIRNILENKEVENKLNKILLKLSNTYCD